MTSEDIRDMLRAKPFRPFQLNLADGDSFQVFHPDFAMISPNGETVVAYTRDNQMKMIDVMLITSIEHVNGRTRRPQKKRR
jgi:hypothetical protein